MKLKIITILMFFFFLISTQIYSQSGWFRQSPLPNPLALNSVRFINNNTGLCVGRKGSIKKTTNGGLNWKNITSPTYKNLNYLIFINQTTGFAIGDSSVIIKSTNAGDNWILSYNSISKNSINSIYFINENTGFAYRDSNNVIFKTINCGINWSNINTDLVTYSWFQSLLFINENTGFYNCGYIYKTTNSGINWRTIDLYPNYFGSMYFFDQTTGLAFGEYGYIFKTTNTGDNWTFLTQVNPNYYLTSVKFIDSSNGFLFANFDYGQMYRTTDKGNNWITLNGTAYTGNQSFDFSDINTGYIISSTGRIIKSTNSGFNWNIISSGCIKRLNKIHFINPNIGYAVGEDAILKTSNGGNFWISLSGKFYNDEIIYVHCFDTNSIITASWNYIQKSTNGGMNWEVKDYITTGNLEAAYFINNIGYYFCGGGVMGKTTDFGESWIHLNTDINSIHAICFINDNTGFAGNIGLNIFKTINGGINWNQIYSGPLIGEICSLQFIDSVTGFIATPNYLLKTSNGGYNWIPGIPSTLYEISSLNMINYSVGYLTFFNGQILMTNDGGQNWISQNTGTNIDLYGIFFLDTNIGWAVGDVGTILKTIDGGGNVWINQNTEQIPDKFILSQNYPNPFNPTTNIKYAIPKDGFVTVKIYDLLGREINKLVSETQKAGFYYVQFNGSSLSSGVYFYRIQSGSFVQTKKMVLIK